MGGPTPRGHAWLKLASWLASQGRKVKVDFWPHKARAGSRPLAFHLELIFINAMWVRERAGERPSPQPCLAKDEARAHSLTPVGHRDQAQSQQLPEPGARLGEIPESLHETRN